MGKIVLFANDMEGILIRRFAERLSWKIQAGGSDLLRIHAPMAIDAG